MIIQFKVKKYPSIFQLKGELKNEPYFLLFIIKRYRIAFSGFV